MVQFVKRAAMSWPGVMLAMLWLWLFFNGETANYIFNYFNLFFEVTR